MDPVKSVILSCFLLLFTAPVIDAQITPREIDALVEDAMEKFNVAGVGIGIVKDGKIFHAKGFGVKSVETREPVDVQTCFAIASNSKAFTTAALAILVEEGKLSWQDRVVDIIPEFRMYNDYVTNNFLIEDLLTHRSGLGKGAGDLQIWPDGGDFTMQDLLTNFQYFEPVSPFRTRYDYDNILYKVAGEVIKRISGKSWGEFVKERILEPLGMEYSYTLPPRMVQSGNLASPHLEVEGELKVIPYSEFDPEKTNGAAGGVLSNPDDLCKWMMVQLNGGKYGINLEKQLFSEASHHEMWSIHTPIDFDPDPRYKTHFMGYGLGWRLKDLNGNLCVYHGGDLNGMLSKTLMIPDLHFGIVVLTNTYYGGEGLHDAVIQTIVDRLLGLEEYDWTGYYLEQSMESSGNADEQVRQVWATVEAADNSHLDKSLYTGIYEDNWFGKIRIEKRDGQLWFTSLRSPKLTGPMYYYKANAFAIRWERRELDADAFAVFSLDREGNPVSMTMEGISPDIDFSYDFQDLFFKRIEGR